jgi:parallel beta-helix repeat protein
MIGSTIIPVSATTISEKSFQPMTMESILYVGGSGPGNYTRIQDAIDNASDGDTVYVYSRTYTSVLLNKYITLLGENKTTTIIDATGADIGIAIMGNDDSNTTENGITISGFTIKNANTGDYQAGIFIANYANPIRNINIYGNIITQNTEGITNFDGIDCQIFNNTITDNKDCGIDCIDSRVQSYITNNIITNNHIGIQAAGYEPLIIEMNQIEGNEVGIDMVVESENTIQNNNFINNMADVEINGYFTPITFLLWTLFFKMILKTKWDGNYWDEWNTRIPKPVIGAYELELIIYLGGDKIRRIPLGTYPYIRYDWHPAQEPLDIPGMS